MWSQERHPVAAVPVPVGLQAGGVRLRGAEHPADAGGTVDGVVVEEQLHGLVPPGVYLVRVEFDSYAGRQTATGGRARLPLG